MHDSTPRKIAYWTHGLLTEDLSATSIGEAVRDAIDADPAIASRKTLAVHGYARMIPTLSAKGILLDILERLDEEYGDPSGDGSVEITSSMLAAAEALCRAVLDGYESWACDLVTTETILIANHIESDTGPPTPKGEV